MKTISTFFKVFFYGLASVIAIFVLITLFATFKACEGSNEGYSANNQEGYSVYGWQIDTIIDPMTSKKTVQHKSVSKEQYEFQFPYNGGSKLILLIKEGLKKQVIFQITKGQILTNTKIMVRFNDAQPISYSVNEAVDYSSDIVFVSYANDFLSRIKKADSIKVQVNVFEEGSPVYTFYTSNY